MLSEDRLRLARKTLHELNSKVSGFLHLAPRTPFSELLPADWQAQDQALLHLAQRHAEKAILAYQSNAFTEVGNLLVTAVQSLTEYINQVVQSRRGAALSSAVPVVTAVLGRFDTAFSPLCPFLFYKLHQWLHVRAIGVSAVESNHMK